MKTVFICSPYRGDVAENVDRAIGYCRRAVMQGLMPFCPHIYFTRFLDDDTPEERSAGMAAGLVWLEHCDEVWVFGEPTQGMEVEILHAAKTRKKVVRFNA